jgi:electron transfer flavoprotein alpha subunit
MAGLLNGAVGASRGAVDEGWMPPGAQIGQTGKIVAPNVYFAVGVSGASQHLAGISNAKCVVAINKDNEANIFKRARFGIVGDYKKAVPALINALKESA